MAVAAQVEEPAIPFIKVRLLPENYSHFGSTDPLRLHLFMRERSRTQINTKQGEHSEFKEDTHAASSH